MWLLMHLITKETCTEMYKKYTFLESEKPGESNGGHTFL